MSSTRWTRKWAHDVETDGFSPIPTQVVSNEEYLPLDQTPEQQRVAALLAETARRNARRLGVSRREFVSSSAGMASAFIALNCPAVRQNTVDIAALFWAEGSRALGTKAALG